MSQNVFNANNKGKRNLPKSEMGFTLIEMVIAMIIFLIITGAIYSLLQLGTFDRNRTSRRADIMKNARAAIHLIGRDALNAGLGYHQSGGIVGDDSLNNLLGLPLDAGTERDSLTSIIVGNDILPNDLQNDATHRTDIITFAYRDYSFNNGDAVRINTPTTGSGPAVARITSKDGPIFKNSDPTSANLVPIDSANKYDLYIVEGGNSQVAVMATEIIDSSKIDFAPNDPLGINQPMNGSGNNRSLLKGCSSGQTEGCINFDNATLKKFFWVSYKVTQEGTLIRTLYGNNNGASSTNQIQQQPLAYNIRDLQFKYVLRDGTVTDNPNGLSVNSIAQITVSIEVQSTEDDEQIGEYQIIKLNSTFGVRNLQYDAG